MILTSIAAMSKNHCIGVNNDLPWNIPEDMKHFRETTRGKIVIMGRKTLESMNGPLPKRRNLILTRDQSYRCEGVEVFHSLEEVLGQLKSENLPKEEEVFICGGGEIYEQAMPFINRLILTIIDKEIDGHAFFPEINWNEFEIEKEVQSSQQEPEPLDYTFVWAKRSSL